jgi:CheY-like chemotaxis protein
MTSSESDKSTTVARARRPTLKALVVDDDPTVRRLLTHLLERRFHARVTGAEHGEQGLEAIAADAPDFAVVDVALRVLVGWVMLRRIRAGDATRALPVVAVWAANDRESVTRMIELGVLDYLLKPINPTIAERRFARVLSTLGLISTGG